MSTNSKYVSVVATPVKSFFVSMLTRDIKLEDAILDLLDNSVDGVLRLGTKGGDKPFEGFWVGITFDKDSFTISDNCGGIPWSLRDYAFRMGKTHDYEPTLVGSLGVYGIGMKRAIFKIGRYCLITTKNENDSYEVEIPPTWFEDESDWNLPVKASAGQKYDGTAIVIKNLNPGIPQIFGEGFLAFSRNLEEAIQTNYAYIIEKGLSIKINGHLITPITTKLVFDTDATEDVPTIRPYIFTTNIDGVDVFLAIGFTRGIPSQAEALNDQDGKKYKSESAGWTILCNDRVVLYADKTILTGWGEAKIPHFHTQFIAISGIVEFRSNDAKKLPTTTTKRGIDANNPIYLQVKNKMLEGLRIFTDYTNKWKTREPESRKYIQEKAHLSLAELKIHTERLTLKSYTKSYPPGYQYKPILPSPSIIKPTQRRISFIKDLSDINKIAEYLSESSAQPSEIGEKCFDIILDEAKK
jgi:hypothetical protein